MRKRGKLSTKEEVFITESKDRLSIEKIAVHINRSPDVVKRFLHKKALQHAGMSVEESTDATLKARLHSRAYWPEVRAQFSKTDNVEELQYFERLWVALVKQFAEDVLMTEELQIKQWITLDILMNRSMQERKRNIENIERLHILLDKELRLDKEERDSSSVSAMEQQLGFLRQQVSSYTADHMKMLEKMEKIQRDLRATRQDRITKVEDGKTSFIGLIRMLEEADIREKFGLEAEVWSRAVDKARKDMSAYHTYEDGKVDQPFLSAETLIENEDTDGQTED